METLENLSEHCYVKCDCCGTETLAEIKEDKLVIMDRRHGRRHLVVLTLREILEKMKSFGRK